MGDVMNMLAKQTEMVAELRQKASLIDKHLEGFENHYNTLSVQELEFLNYLMRMAVEHIEAIESKKLRSVSA